MSQLGSLLSRLGSRAGSCGVVRGRAGLEVVLSRVLCQAIFLIVHSGSKQRTS